MNIAQGIMTARGGMGYFSNSISRLSRASSAVFIIGTSSSPVSTRTPSCCTSSTNDL